MYCALRERETGSEGRDEGKKEVSQLEEREWAHKLCFVCIFECGLELEGALS